MDLNSFHDGHFDGIRLEPDRSAQIFLRATDGTRCILVLKGVEALTVSGLKAGNIILDLVIRSSHEATSADVEELYDLDVDSEQIAKLMESMRQKGLQILELNPSYGAQGLFLFENFEIREVNDLTASALRPA